MSYLPLSRFTGSADCTLIFLKRCNIVKNLTQVHHRGEGGRIPVQVNIRSVKSFSTLLQHWIKF